MKSGVTTAVTNWEICRVAWFSQLGVGLALILVGLALPAFAENQCRVWLNPDEYANPQTRDTATRLIRRIDGRIRIAGLVVGGLIVLFSGIGLAALGRPVSPTPPPEMPLAPTPASASRWPKVVGFSVMFLGLAVVVWGQAAEAASFRPRETGDPIFRDFGREERSRADIAKTAGLGCVLLGPAIWFVLDRVGRPRTPAGTDATPAEPV